MTWSFFWGGKGEDSLARRRTTALLWFHVLGDLSEHCLKEWGGILRSVGNHRQNHIGAKLMGLMRHPEVLDGTDGGHTLTGSRFILELVVVHQAGEVSHLDHLHIGPDVLVIRDPLKTHTGIHVHLGENHLGYKLDVIRRMENDRFDGFPQGKMGYQLSRRFPHLDAYRQSHQQKDNS